MKKNIILSFSLIFCLACTLEAGVSRVLINQNFEDQSVFPWAQAFDITGLGDSTTTAGLWKNFQLEGNWTPKAYYDNSDFSKGNQCVNIVRSNLNYGSGFVVGYRTDAYASDQFLSQISILLTQPGCRFSLFLVDANDLTNDSGVGICYFDEILYVCDNQSWSARSSGVTLGKWFKITFAGSISAGTYKTYINLGSGESSLGIASFSEATLPDVAGMKIAPYVEGFEVYFDDFILAEGSLPLENCAEYYMFGSRVENDLNGDCYVNLADFTVLAEGWMESLE